MTRPRNEQLNLESISEQEQLNDSSSEAAPTDPIVYLKLPRRLFKFLRGDFIKNRRKSVSSTLSSDAPDDANSPWDIKNTNQLQRWVDVDSDNVMKMLDELRKQRDLGIEACELFEQIPADDIWKSRFEEAARSLKRLAKELSDKDKAYAKELSDLRFQMADMAQRQREETPSGSTLSQSSSKRSIKLPDPPQFSDGIDPEWDSWYDQIQAKLEVNADHFINERARLAYVHSRLAGDAARATHARRQKDSSNAYETTEDLLTDLAQLYDDPDKEANYRREYNDLTQGIKKFNDFYSQFQRLASYLGYQEKQLIADLRDRINPRLRLAWSSQVVQPKTLVEIRNYLVRLDNEHKAMRELKEKEPVKVKTTKQVTFEEYSSSAPRRTEGHRYPDASKPRGAVLTSAKETDQFEGNCFTCHKPGHTSKECPNRITKVSALDDDSHEYDRSSSDSDFDSKN